MRDKSLGVLLGLIFGLSGMAMVALAWVGPMVQAERILRVVVGSSGLILAVVLSLLLRSLPAKADDVVVDPVKVDDKS